MREAGRSGSAGQRMLVGVALALVASLLGGAEARAAGIAAARFGGEHGHPTTDNPTAIYYNPAGIALSKGTHIFVDGTLALRAGTYDRPLSAVDPYTPPYAGNGQPAGSLGANNGEASVFNAIANPFFGVTSDFGTDFLAAGLSFSVPFGGSAVWDQNDAFAGNTQFPGAVDGTQRWYTIDGSIQSMYLSGAFAYRIKEIGLSLGVSASAIRSTVKTLRARNGDGSDNLVTPETAATPEVLKEGRSFIDVEGWQWGFGVGAIWEALPDMLWIGASYTSRPNVTGGMTLEGTLGNTLGTATPTVTDVDFTQDLPDIVRLGFRVRPTPEMEARLFGDWTHWSVAVRQCVLDKNAKGGPNCDIVETGDPIADAAQSGGNGPASRGVVQHLPRYWNDSFGIRAGYSYWFMKEIEAYLGFGYDSSAIPVETLDPAIFDMDKFTLGIGGRFQVIENLNLAFTYTHVFYLTVNTDGKSVLDDFQAPTRQPSGDGEYSQSIELFNLAADVSF